MDPDPPPDSAASGDLSEQVQRAATTIEQLRVQLHLRLRSEYWFGERADAVRRMWESTVSPALEENARLLRAMLVEAIDTRDDRDARIDDADGA